MQTPAGRRERGSPGVQLGEVPCPSPPHLPTPRDFHLKISANTLYPGLPEQISSWEGSPCHTWACGRTIYIISSSKLEGLSRQRWLGYREKTAGPNLEQGEERTNTHWVPTRYQVLFVPCSFNPPSSRTLGMIIPIFLLRKLRLKDYITCPRSHNQLSGKDGIQAIQHRLYFFHGTKGLQ